MKWTLKNWHHGFSQGDCYCYQCKREIKPQNPMVYTSIYNALARIPSRLL